MTLQKRQFQNLVWRQYRAHGRSFLPWRKNPTPYRVFVSEMMLQQTQAERVTPKFKLFIQRFPNFQTLARAPQKDVVLAWQGLGYNRRALALKRAAEAVVREHGGRLPKTHEALVKLAGVGPYTAGAIRAFAFNTPALFIETNIRAALLYHFFPKSSNVDDRLVLRKLEALVGEKERKNPREWYSALMDYGAYVKTRHGNPNNRSKHYAKQARFRGSDREVRGGILKLLVSGAKSEKAIVASFDRDPKTTQKLLADLVREEFVKKGRGGYRLF